MAIPCGLRLLVAVSLTLHARMADGCYHACSITQTTGRPTIVVLVAAAAALTVLIDVAPPGDPEHT